MIVEKLLFCRTLLLADLYEEGKSLVEILCHEGRQVKTQTFLIAFNESFYNVLHFQESMFYGWLCQRNAQQVLLISTKDEWRSFGCLFLQAALSCQDDPEQHQMRRQ